MDIHNWSVRSGAWEFVAADGERIVTRVAEIFGIKAADGEDRYLVPGLLAVTVNGEKYRLTGPTVIYRWRTGTMVFRDHVGNDIVRTPATHRGGDGCDVIEVPGLDAVTVLTKAQTIGSIPEPATDR